MILSLGLRDMLRPSRWRTATAKVKAMDVVDAVILGVSSMPGWEAQARDLLSTSPYLQRMRKKKKSLLQYGRSEERGESVSV